MNEFYQLKLGFVSEISDIKKLKENDLVTYKKAVNYAGLSVQSMFDNEKLFNMIILLVQFILETPPRLRQESEINLIIKITDMFNFFQKINQSKKNQVNRVQYKICQHLKLHKYQRGQILIRQHEQADAFYLLVKGKVNIFKMRKDQEVKQQMAKDTKVGQSYLKLQKILQQLKYVQGQLQNLQLQIQNVESIKKQKYKENITLSQIKNRVSRLSVRTNNLQFQGKQSFSNTPLIIPQRVSIMNHAPNTPVVLSQNQKDKRQAVSTLGISKMISTRIQSDNRQIKVQINQEDQSSSNSEQEEEKQQQQILHQKTFLINQQQQLLKQRQQLQNLLSNSEEFKQFKQLEGLEFEDILNWEYFYHKGIFKFKEIAQFQDISSFGDQGLLFQNKRSASVVCMQDCIILRLDHQSFVKTLGDVINNKIKKKMKLIQQSILYNLPKYKLIEYFEYFQKQTYKKGDILFEQGQQLKQIYIIYKGDVSIIKKQKLKKIHLLNLNKINVLGIRELIDDVPAEFTAQVCSTPTKIYSINYQYVKRLMNDYSELNQKIQSNLQVLEEQIENQLENYKICQQYQNDQQLIRLNIDLKHMMYERKFDQSIKANQKISNKQKILCLRDIKSQNDIIAYNNQLKKKQYMDRPENIFTLREQRNQDLKDMFKQFQEIQTAKKQIFKQERKMSINLKKSPRITKQYSLDYNQSTQKAKQFSCILQESQYQSEVQYQQALKDLVFNHFKERSLIISLAANNQQRKLISKLSFEVAKEKHLLKNELRVDGHQSFKLFKQRSIKKLKKVNSQKLKPDNIETPPTTSKIIGLQQNSLSRLDSTIKKIYVKTKFKSLKKGFQEYLRNESTKSTLHSTPQLIISKHRINYSSCKI